MSTLHAAALVWPFLLVVAGLVIGRMLRRADRTDSHEEAGPAAEPVPLEAEAPTAAPEVVPATSDDDPGPEAAELPASR